MNEETIVTETNTDDTKVDTTTEETPAVENAPVNDKPAVDEVKEEKAEEKAEVVEFVEYDFDKDVKLPKNYTLPDTAKTALNELGKELGIPADKIQVAVDKFIAVTEANSEAATEVYLADNEKMMQGWDATLDKDWGDDKAKNLATIDKVITRFIPKTAVKEGEQTLSNYLIGTPDADGKMPPINPLLGNFLLEIGKVMSSDTLETGQAQTGKPKTMKDKFMYLNK